MLVQPGLYRTCSETTLLVFPRGGSYVQSLFKFQKENVEYVNTKELFENDSRLVYSDRFHQKVMPNVSSVHIPVEIYNGGKDFLKMLLYKTESQSLHAVSSLLDNSQIGLYTQQEIKTNLRATPNKLVDAHPRPPPKKSPTPNFFIWKKKKILFGVFFFLLCVVFSACSIGARVLR